MKDALGHGSDGNGQAAATLAQGHPKSAPSFVDYARSKLGNNYMVARASDRNRERFPGSTFVTARQHAAVKDQYRQEHPEAARRYFGAL